MFVIKNKEERGMNRVDTMNKINGGSNIINNDFRGRSNKNKTIYSQIIAVDFDGTLCEECWPEIGKPNLRLIGELIYRKSLGDKIILWTCRAGVQLEEAVNFCGSYGLTFDAINDNLPEIVERYGNNSRKITADIYIDDKSEKPWLSLLENAV